MHAQRRMPDWETGEDEYYEWLMEFGAPMTMWLAFLSVSNASASATGCYFPGACLLKKGIGAGCPASFQCHRHQSPGQLPS